MIEYHNNIAIIKDATHWTEWVKTHHKLDVDGSAYDIVDRYITPSSTVADIGANIGAHSIVYAQKITSNDKLYAFDPDPEHCLCLKHNLPDWVVVVPMAISDTIGTIGYKRYTNTGCNRCVDNDSMDRVNTTTIDHYFHNIPIDFIKIDIEGYELKALIGAQHTIQTYKPIICLEANKSALAEAGTSQQELYSYIEHMQYNFYCLSPKETLYNDQPNIICTPKSKNNICL